ncbi:MAG: EAL domain-containing protein [Pseudomonadota bacterium]
MSTTSPTRESNVVSLPVRRAETGGAQPEPARIFEFAPAASARETDRLGTAEQVRCEVEQVITAIAANRIEVLFQPQVTLADDRLVGLEALVRLRDEDGQFLDTGRVVTLAEQQDIIGVLGRRAVETAVVAFSQSAFAGTDVRLALNCSPLELSNRGYAIWLTSLLEDSGLDPRQVELEVTENTPVDLRSPQPEQLTALHEVGVGIAVDDFGRGFANWQRVLSLPTTTVKLDRAIIAKVLTCQRTELLIGHLARTGQDLGYRLVAEGIETPEQAERVQAAGCAVGQGFGLGRPVPLSVLERRGRS